MQPRDIANGSAILFSIYSELQSEIPSLPTPNPLKSQSQTSPKPLALNPKPESHAHQVSIRARKEALKQENFLNTLKEGPSDFRSAATSSSGFMGLKAKGLRWVQGLSCSVDETVAASAAVGGDAVAPTSAIVLPPTTKTSNGYDHSVSTNNEAHL